MRFNGGKGLLLIALDHELVGNEVLDAVAFVIGEVAIRSQEENLNIEAGKRLQEAVAMFGVEVAKWRVHHERRGVRARKV